MQKDESAPSQDISSLLSDGMELILYNDEYNTFDYVIKCLIEVCLHKPEQAEQCALIAHLKGKCGIKFGTYEELAPINNELNNRGLSTVLA